MSFGAMIDSQPTAGKNLISINGGDNLGQIDFFYGAFWNFKTAANSLDGMHNVVFGQNLEDFCGERLWGINFFGDVFYSYSSILIRL